MDLREHHLTRLLISTSSVRGRRRATIASLAAKVNEDRLLALWSRHRLTVIAGERLAAVTPVSETIESSVAEQRAEARAVAAMHLLISRQAQGVLAQAGIPSAILKGPALAERLHGDTGARGASGDIDVLVSCGQLHQASEMLQRQGWGAPSDLRNHEDLPIQHFSLPGPGIPGIDLHWRPQWFAGSGAYAEELIQRTVEQGGLRVPDPIDDLVLLLTSHARDGFSGLRTPADIAAWWATRSEPDSVSDTLASRLGSYGELRGVLSSATLIANALVATPTYPTAAALERKRVRWAASQALTPMLKGREQQLLKCMAVDAAVAPETLRARWDQAWFPRRARSVRASAAMGRSARWLIAPSAARDMARE